MSRFSLKHLIVGLVAVAVVALVAMATGLVHTPDALTHVVSTFGNAFASDTYSGLALAAGAPALVTKDPRALALRAEAEKLEAELTDPANKFSKDEVEQKASHIAGLHQRAALIANFTPTAAIDQRGGDDPLKIRAPGSDDEIVRTPQVQAEAIRKRAIQEFGSVGKLVRAIGKNQQSLTEGQQGLIKELGTLTRTIVGTASDPSGGEFLLPLQQEPSIFKVANVQAGILRHARQYQVTGRTLRIPYVVQDQATGASGVVTLPLSGGIADISIIGEGGTKPVAQPSFAQRLLTAYKWAAYTEMGDEVLDDDFTGDLSPTVLEIIGNQVMNTMDDKMTFSGSGTSEPLGALHANNGALLSFARTGAGALATADIFNMYKAHTFGPNSYWSISRYTIAALMALTLGSNTLVSWLPNLRDGLGSVPYLLGLPVRMNDFQPVLGTKGDIALINPDFYAVGMRQQVTIDVSEHFQFRNDVTAYRFLARAGGLPIPLSTYAYRATGTTKTQEHSPFVCINT